MGASGAASGATSGASSGSASGAISGAISGVDSGANSAHPSSVAAEVPAGPRDRLPYLPEQRYQRLQPGSTLWEGAWEGGQLQPERGPPWELDATAGATVDAVSNAVERAARSHARSWNNQLTVAASERMREDMAAREAVAAREAMAALMVARGARETREAAVAGAVGRGESAADSTPASPELRGTSSFAGGFGADRHTAFETGDGTRAHLSDRFVASLQTCLELASDLPHLAGGSFGASTTAGPGAALGSALGSYIRNDIRNDIRRFGGSNSSSRSV